MPRKSKTRDNVSHEDSPKRLPLLDDLDQKIIRDIMNDANAKNAEIASRYRSPLSTIQRRRTQLERKILKKRYHIDITQLGWRRADLLISVEEGNSEEIAKKIMDEYKGNILATSLRIGDPEINLMAQACYRSTEELHNLIEGIQSIHSIKSVQWSELVRIMEANYGQVVNRIFGINPD